jgi:hypothetical protein
VATQRRAGFLFALVACLGLYAGVVLGSPGLHHDLDCHLKTPGHCQACVANPLAPRAEPSSTLGVVLLLEVGSPLGADASSCEPTPLSRPSGRSPPR